MIALCALLGLVVGACLNLIADLIAAGRRQPRTPFCRYCDQSRPPWAWFATLAFLRFRPDCSHCGAPISRRHLLTELGTAGLFALLWHQFGPTILLLVYGTYSALLILIAVVDLERRLIPNQLIYTGWILALMGSLCSPVRGFWLQAILGGVAGFAVLFLVHLGSKVFLRLAAKPEDLPAGSAGFGLGDVRLGALIGLMLGVPWVFTALLLAVLLGGLAALLFWPLHAIIRRSYTPFTLTPYAPWLVSGALLTMVLHPVIHLPGLQG